MTRETDPTSGSEPPLDDPVRLDLRIGLPEDARCTVADVDGEVAGVSHRLKRESRDRRADRRECHAEVVVDDGDGVRHEYRRSKVTPGCVCRVFERFDCIPEIRAVEGEAIIVSVLLPDRSGLREVVRRLRETGATVGIERAVRRSSGEATVEVDAGEITAKQREAAEVAVEAGYYEAPRRADLEELADRLGVSKSAVSQRLNAVESKLVRSLIDERR